MGTVLSRNVDNEGVREEGAPSSAERRDSMEVPKMLEIPIAMESPEAHESPGGLPRPEAADGDEAETRRKAHEEEMASFREQWEARKARRREALDGLSKKIAELREELGKERAERTRLEVELARRRAEEVGGEEPPEEVSEERALLLAKEEEDSKAEVEGLRKQVKALKDVAAIGGEMLRIRELQVNELREKMKAIEETGSAYEKEVENMRKLRKLYEERSRAILISHQMEVEREKAKTVVIQTKLDIAEEKNKDLLDKNKELQDRIELLDTTVDKNNSEISDLRIQLAGKKEELYNVTSQMAIINNLFSQVLADPESLDRVTRVLEEHHNLVNHLTEKGNINDVASVLMKVADKDHIMTEEEKDIAGNLSKVWRLLVELLGHHNKPVHGEPMPESCYKSVDTPTGPKLVISVSQTFLRLKDLILEKNSLVQEVGRLKDLNSHLEKRLISQEARLAEVADELHKTWGVVNKLKTQHKALHTHEQVLRYELKHKRMMLNQLKEQLQDCREMWQLARVKNSQTEKDWEELRKEFAERKQQISSAESGYEESPGDSQDEEDAHKISEDESDMQDFPSVKCPRIRRLRDSEQCTPDRSNTPDIMEEPYAEDVSERSISTSESTEETVEVTSEENLAGPAVQSSSSPTIANEMPPGPANETLRDPANAMTHDPSNEMSLYPSSEMVIDPAIEVATGPATLPEIVTVVLQSSVQILPWNDSPEEGKLVEDSKTIPPTDLEEKCKSEEMRPENPRSDSERNELPETSTTKSSMVEEILARREARMKKLEEQCQSLVSKVSDTNKRSDMISSKLVQLHEQYGESSALQQSHAVEEEPISERRQDHELTSQNATEENISENTKNSSQ